MKIGWGWKIALLYGCFVAMMVTLVIASSRQQFDLVSKNYYKDEIAYQDVLDAGKNHAGLSAPIAIHGTEDVVVLDFPAELSDKILSGTIRFYSPVNAEWDKTFRINASGNSVSIARSALHNTQYTIKIDFEADGKKFYQESEIQLSK